MKLLLFGLAGLLSFVGSLVAILALTGNLSAEALARLRGREPEISLSNPLPAPDMLGSLAQELKSREARLKKWEDTLKQREAQLDQRESEIEKVRSATEEIRREISLSMDEKTEEHRKAVESSANSVANMKPSSAAEVLKNLPESDVAEILALVKDKDRGKILDAMDPRLVSKVLQSLQEQNL